jgi:D-glycero-D-manno-heptose 1,7-bisphosphate phosphatase
MRHQTVFLDRDGVINRMRSDYVKRWEELELLPGAVDALVRIARSGRDVIVLTNQSAIAQNLVTVEAITQIHNRLAALVAQRGGQIRAFLVCPHVADDGCDCRKPLPGLFFRARDELGIDLTKGVMVGDQFWDVQAARAAGCSAILVNSDTHAWDHEVTECPVVASLVAAVDLICGE